MSIAPSNARSLRRVCQGGAVPYSHRKALLKRSV